MSCPVQRKEEPDEICPGLELYSSGEKLFYSEFNPWNRNIILTRSSI